MTHSPTAAVKRKPHGWMIVVAVLATAGGAFALWDQVLQDYFVANAFGVVEPGSIYRSGQLSRHLVESTLREHHIKVIVDLTSAAPDNPDQQAELAAAKELGIDHDRYPMPGDGEGTAEAYTDALTRIAQATRAGEPVLVHCTRARSGPVA